MTKDKPRESPENRTFRMEGWLVVAFPLALLVIGLIAAIVAPLFAQG